MNFPVDCMDYKNKNHIEGNESIAKGVQNRNSAD